MIYVMSDIHGCLNRYRNVLRQIRLRKDDHLYILGDVIDRGPEGLRILKDTMERGNVTLLLGNHEHMMLEALSHPDNDELLELWYANGGRVTHEHFKHCNLTYRAEVLSYIRNLPLNLEVSVNGTDYLLVHGAPASTYTKGSRYVNQTEYAVWTRLGRNTLLFEDKIVIFGHTPTYHYNHEYPMAGIRLALTAAVPGEQMEGLEACVWMTCRNSIQKKVCDDGFRCNKKTG